jgi:hypothetical protein
MHLKFVGYTDTVLFPTIGNAVNVQPPDIGKLIYIAEKIRYSKLAANLGNFWSPR